MGRGVQTPVSPWSAAYVYSGGDSDSDECHQTKGLMTRAMAVHVRYKSLYISLPSSAKQQRETTKFYVFWRTQTAIANFSYLLELNAVSTCLV